MSVPADFAGLGQVFARLSAILDCTIDHATERELHWERVGKIPEESGEMFGAFIGWLGTNPRKGRTHALDAVLDELLDVAVSALGAWEHLSGAAGRSMDALAAHAAAKTDRLAPFVPSFVSGDRVTVDVGGLVCDAVVSRCEFDSHGVPCVVHTELVGRGQLFAVRPHQVRKVVDVAVVFAAGDPVTVTVPGAGDWPGVVAEVIFPASGTTVVQCDLVSGGRVAALSSHVKPRAAEPAGTVEESR